MCKYFKCKNQPTHFILVVVNCCLPLPFLCTPCIVRVFICLFLLSLRFRRYIDHFGALHNLTNESRGKVAFQKTTVGNKQSRVACPKFGHPVHFFFSSIHFFFHFKTSCCFIIFFIAFLSCRLNVQLKMQVFFDVLP